MLTPLYAALLGLIFVGLSIRVILVRKKLKVAIGTAREELLSRAARVHANFAEYVPLAIILIYFLEMSFINDDSQWLIHLLGTSLIVGRLSHSYGVSQINENFKFRVTGMLLTFSVIIVASLMLLFGYINNF